ncbi:MAG TPA: hypothetical protein VL049_30120, partial [Candidatus Dormibacteraeota bacterium]|nr:hypothetical protein [Candidatus Dormibacteraeota bacterium]
ERRAIPVPAAYIYVAAHIADGDRAQSAAQCDRAARAACVASDSALALRRANPWSAATRWHRDANAALLQHAPCGGARSPYLRRTFDQRR